MPRHPQHLTTARLLLVVRPSGARSWILRYQVAGRRRDFGLGPWPEVSLAEARERALTARRLTKAGRDPIIERGHRQGQGMTFSAAAEALIEAKRPGWRNAKHAAQWRSTLETYACSKLGTVDVQAIDTVAILDVLRPIWTTKTETASRVRQRIEAVLDYATAVKAGKPLSDAALAAVLERMGYGKITERLRLPMPAAICSASVAA